jgi:hypothetical protein
MVEYGKGWPCVRCNRKDDEAHTIGSTDDVERVAFELADRLAPVCQDRGRMLGVMYADGEWIVTLSHVAAVEYEFVHTVMKMGGRMSPIAHDWSTVPRRSLGGHDIRHLLSTERRAGTWNAYFEVKGPDGAARPEGIAGGPGCVCAAPKLVSYLTQDAGAHLLPPREVAMVELWCGATRTDRQGNATRRHKEIAVSCSNCRKILPTLFCRAPARA